MNIHKRRCIVRSNRKLYSWFNSLFTTRIKNLAFFVSFIFVSCSNVQQTNVSSDENKTIRNETDELLNVYFWTDALEPTRLSSSVSTLDGISEKMALSPLSVMSANSQISAPIYPSIEGFGSLDTTLINDSLRDTLSQFCLAVSKNEFPQPFMTENSLYSLLLFYSDFKDIFSDKFDFDSLPEPKTVIKSSKASETSETESSKKDGDDGKNSKNSKNSKKDEKTAKKEEVKVEFFKSFIFGEPFVDGKAFEVPVRFYGSDFIFDISVYCCEEKSEWKIDQIQILGRKSVEKKN